MPWPRYTGNVERWILAISSELERRDRVRVDEHPPVIRRPRPIDIGAAATGPQFLNGWVNAGAAAPLVQKPLNLRFIDLGGQFAMVQGRITNPGGWFLNSVGGAGLNKNICNIPSGFTPLFDVVHHAAGPVGTNETTVMLDATNDVLCIYYGVSGGAHPSSELNLNFIYPKGY
jgi:hypothetical protein